MKNFPLTTAAICLATVLLVLSALAGTIWPPESAPQEADGHQHLSVAAHEALHAAEPRSPQWPKVRASYLDKHPTCEACGGTEGLQVHHVQPFHLFPDKELDPGNLITLCTHPAWNCHLGIGHSGDFKAYNPHVREDAALMLKRRQERKYEVQTAKKPKVSCYRFREIQYLAAA